MSFSSMSMNAISGAFERIRHDLASRGTISTLILDSLFPPRCGGCFRLGKELFCYRCQLQIRPVVAPFCACCGFPFDPNAFGNDRCASCRLHNPKYDAARSHQRFEGPMREAIHRLKYRKQFDYGRRMAPLLFELMENDPTLRAFEAQLLVPVPLHISRLRSRGFNQSAILAQELSRISDIPLREALVRTRKTSPQVGLSAQERKKNVRGAFEIASDTHLKSNEKPPIPVEEEVEGARILLIDDVFTTGATLNECAAVLKKAGASAVIALTLASQRSPHDNEPIRQHVIETIV